MSNINSIRNAIIKDNVEFTKLGYNPIFRAYEEAKIVIIGQAPGITTQLKDDVFRDESGDRLREWMGIDEKVFYDSKMIAVLPMDFYYPGKAKTGDKPPRKDFADKWHPLLLECMSNVKLVLLIGMYAQKHYLPPQMRRSTIDAITKDLKNPKRIIKTILSNIKESFVIMEDDPLNYRNGIING